MEKNITVKKFVEDYIKLDEKLKDKYLEDNLIIEEYVPFEDKVAQSSKILQKSCFDADNNLFIDTTLLEMLQALSIVNLWTNIELSTNKLDDFNLLNRYDVISIIINLIPEKEIAEYISICNKKKSDIYVNFNSPSKITSTIIMGISEMITSTMDVIYESLGNINIDSDVIDSLTNIKNELLK